MKMTYGIKTILHNTKRCLLHGEKYNLLHVNYSRMTSLMYAITNNSVEVFLASNDVRTTFLGAIIEPKIQALSYTREQVKELLTNVGFTLDRNAKPYNHNESTCISRCCVKQALTSVMLQQARGTTTETPAPWTRQRSGSQDASKPDAVLSPVWLLGRRAAPA